MKFILRESGGLYIASVSRTSRAGSSFRVEHPLDARLWDSIEAARNYAISCKEIATRDKWEILELEIRVEPVQIARDGTGRRAYSGEVCFCAVGPDWTEWEFTVQSNEVRKCKRCGVRQYD